MLISVVKMANVLPCTTEKQCWVVRFSVGSRTVWEWYSYRSVSSLRWEVSVAVNGSQLGGKRSADEEEVETKVRKWLRQQTKDFYAAATDALVKRWDKCIHVGGWYVGKYIFFQLRISGVLRFISIPIYWLSLICMEDQGGGGSKAIPVTDRGGP
jgi:hypothetical protein